MEVEEQAEPQMHPPQRTRKRKRDETTWERKRKQIERYSKPRDPEYPRCIEHKGPISKYKCQCLTIEDVQNFHEIFYQTSNKIDQDNFILLNTLTSKPVRRRTSKAVKKRGCREYNIEYYVKKANSMERVHVCKEAFLGIICVNRFRVENVIKRHMLTGLMAVEGRGGARKRKKLENTMPQT